MFCNSSQRGGASVTVPERRKGIGAPCTFQPLLPPQQMSRGLHGRAHPLSTALHPGPVPTISADALHLASKHVLPLSSTGNSWKLIHLQDLRPHPRPTRPGSAFLLDGQDFLCLVKPEIHCLEAPPLFLGSSEK